MSHLDYTTLKALVLSTAVRSDLSAEVAGFVRLAEGMIRREVRAMETRTTLLEADRITVGEGRYTLPDTIQEVRVIYGTVDEDSYPLENVGLHGIRMLPADADPLHYAIVGGTIEIRGVPATDTEFEIVGIGWPDPLDTTAQNDLLEFHEAIYIYGSLFHLYQYTQDFELAQSALSVYTDARDKLNALIGRKLGGNSTLPAYNFGHIHTSRGY